MDYCLNQTLFAPKSLYSRPLVLLNQHTFFTYNTPTIFLETNLMLTLLNDPFPAIFIKMKSADQGFDCRTFLNISCVLTSLMNVAGDF